VHESGAARPYTLALDLSVARDLRRDFFRGDLWRYVRCRWPSNSESATRADSFCLANSSTPPEHKEIQREISVKNYMSGKITG
jgi:hypothetical protein